MKKSMKRELGILPKLLIGVGIAALTVVAVSFTLSVISSLTKDPTSLTGIFSLLSLIIAGAVFGFIYTGLSGEGGGAIAFISSAITALLMSIAGLIWCGGKVPFGVFLNYLAYVGATGIFTLLRTRLGFGRRRRYR